MAISAQRPGVGLIHHSDRGVQYASADYRKVMQSAGFSASMSRKADCYDNAPMESFFHTLKTELVHHRHYATRGEAKRDIFAYIEGFYNRTRRHSAIGYHQPDRDGAKSSLTLSIFSGEDQSDSNQLHTVTGTAEVERAVMDLVGDLATYSPRSKIVLLEGGGDSEFDVAFVQRLFPELAERVTLISGGSKRRVQEMHDLLNTASRDKKLDAKFFSIVDRDFEGPEPLETESRFSWDVYHVENYLLDATFILQVVQALEIKHEPLKETEVESKLRDCAICTIDALVRTKMESLVNSTMVRCIRTGVDPTQALAAGFRASAERSKAAIDRALESSLQLTSLVDTEQKICSELDRALQDGRWKAEFRGRDILHQFAGREGLRIPYERFRNLILSEMSEVGHQPPGMKRIVDTIMGRANRLTS